MHGPIGTWGPATGRTMRNRTPVEGEVLGETIDYYRARAVEYEEWWERAGAMLCRKRHGGAGSGSARRSIAPSRRYLAAWVEAADVICPASSRCVQSNGMPVVTVCRKAPPVGPLENLFPGSAGLPQ